MQQLEASLHRYMNKDDDDDDEDDDEEE